MEFSIQSSWWIWVKINAPVCSLCVSKEKIHSMEWDMTKLSIEPKEEVHGILMLLSKRDFEQLAWEEYAYDTVEVPVNIYQEDRKRSDYYGVQHALAFKSASCAIVDSTTLPSTRYIRLIQEGGRTSKIDAEYVDWLNEIPSV